MSSRPIKKVAVVGVGHIPVFILQATNTNTLGRPQATLAPLSSMLS